MKRLESWLTYRPFKLSERGNRRKLVHWYWFALTEGNGDKMEFQPQLLKPTFVFCFTQPSMRNLTISYGWSKKGGGGTGTGRVRSVKSIISRARIFAFYCWLSTTGRLKHNNLPFSPSNYQVDCIKDFLPLHHFFPFLKIIWINTLILSWRLKKKGNPVFVWHIDNCMYQKKNIPPWNLSIDCRT